jgi:DNA-binding response OmpR family regulator
MQRILVCDDDGRTVRALRVILRDAGFRVEAVSSANDALDAAALRPPAGTQALRTHIANLRRKLASPHIRTLHGVGYRFEEPRPRLAVIPGQARSPTRVPDLRAA